MLKLMYITNKPWVAKIAEEAGVDWIFIDMEYLDKAVRQGGMDTSYRGGCEDNKRLFIHLQTVSAVQPYL